MCKFSYNAVRDTLISPPQSFNQRLPNFNQFFNQTVYEGEYLRLSINLDMEKNKIGTLTAETVIFIYELSRSNTKTLTY